MNIKKENSDASINRSLTTLLVVDDDPIFRAQVCHYSRANFKVIEYECAEEISAETLHEAQMIVMDLDMPNVDGLDFIRTLAAISPPPKLLIASAHDKKVIDIAKQTAQLYGLHHTVVVQKPVSHRQFNEAIQSFDEIASALDCHVANEIGSPVISQREIFLAITQNDFIPYYQPQINLSENTLHGIEVLARWKHSTLGILSPERFIKEIETSDLALDFTLRILEKSLQDYVSILSKCGFTEQLSINVPPSILANTNFSTNIISLAQKYDFPLDKLVCEITERGIEKSSAETLATLARLRMHNIKLSVDDFGTGQSGLSKLKSGVFSELKIDRSFIFDLEMCREDHAIVESILSLASRTGIDVVAEGIESEGMLDSLNKLGCKIGQGYLFSKPLSAESIAQWLCDYYRVYSRRENKYVQR